jgi:hypothetical protein
MRARLQLRLINPVQSVDNTFADAFNGCLCDGCLDVERFNSLVDALPPTRELARPHRH